MRRQISTLLVLLSFAGLLAGCATSKPFAEGTVRAAPLLDRDLRHYAGQDSARLAQVDALKAATSNTATVSADAVAPIWDQIKPWYLPAVDADPLLDPLAKQLRHENAARFDKLLAVEKARPLRPPS